MSEHEEVYTIVKRNPELNDFIRHVSLVTPKIRIPDMPGEIHPVGVASAIDTENDRVLVTFRNRLDGSPWFMNRNPRVFYIVRRDDDTEASGSSLPKNNPNGSFKRRV